MVTFPADFFEKNDGHTKARDFFLPSLFCHRDEGQVRAIDNIFRRACACPACFGASRTRPQDEAAAPSRQSGYAAFDEATRGRRRSQSKSPPWTASRRIPTSRSSCPAQGSFVGRVRRRSLSGLFNHERSHIASNKHKASTKLRTRRRRRQKKGPSLPWKSTTRSIPTRSAAAWI